MGKISKEHIGILREYFLSVNEAARSIIRKSISPELLENIALIESAFINDDPITESDLLKLRNEYFISLAEISLAGNTDVDIERLLSSNNQTFKKLLAEMGDADSFEQDAKIAIKAVERDELRKRFQLIDKGEEFEIADNELKNAINVLYKLVLL